VEYLKETRIIQGHRAEGEEGLSEINTDLRDPNPHGIEFDNLYIDMNGIIHPCSHPEGQPAPKTEEEMYVNVFEYLDRLFAAIRPRKLFYLAIDGVAPRAKMNQQRSRRFRTAQEAEIAKVKKEEARAIMCSTGFDDLEEDEEWDSNVITPGTKFMWNLSKYVRFYITERMNSNPAWQDVKVIFSDASVPGEGEHKIMTFIRTQRACPGYNPNLHHVIHGLDADLIMLGLATHEVRFSILREEVLFGRKAHEAREAREAKEKMLGEKRKRGEFGEHDGSSMPTEKKPFQILHIYTLREYLKVEFASLEPDVTKAGFLYDFERIVDDFVFLCFFVGNDFLPHLPSLDIRDGALEFLINIYKTQIPKMGDYLCENGKPILKRVGIILDQVGKVEDEVFRRKKQGEQAMEARFQRQKDMKKRGGIDQINADNARKHAVAVPKKAKLTLKKEGKGSSTVEKEVEIEPDVLAIMDEGKMEGLKSKDVLKKIMKAKEQKEMDEHRKNKVDHVRLHEAGWKDRYYSDKYKSDDIAEGGGREEVFKTYIQGLSWVMEYYYKGCMSWKWFYPFHYAPFASDLSNIERFEKDVEFGESEPFRPFEQLMGVFPSQSFHALPSCMSWLSEEGSPIFDFYPKDIKVDPNGKAMPWLFVVLLPFIDADRLLEQIRKEYAKMTPEETARNSFGNELIFVHAQSATLAPVLLETEAESDPSVETVVRLEEVEAAEKRGDIMGTVQVLADKQLSRQLGRFIGAPKRPPGKLRDIKSNQALWTIFDNAPNRPHKCSILEGAKQLTVNHSGQPLVPKQARQGKGSIANMGGGAHSHVPGALSPFGQYKGGYKGGPSKGGKGKGKQFSGHPFFSQQGGKGNGKGARPPPPPQQFWNNQGGGGGKGGKGKGQFFHQAPSQQHQYGGGGGFKGKGKAPPAHGRYSHDGMPPPPNNYQQSGGFKGHSFGQQHHHQPRGPPQHHNPNAGIDNNALRQHLAATLARTQNNSQHKHF
jgi:5'-3' exoribonuclease 2